MTGFEYKVVPAPTRGLKAKGVKTTPDRFANALQSVMNDLGAEGWEYQRTDTLPVEERQGLTGKTTSFQNMLVFRRSLVAHEDEAPEIAALIEDQSDTVQEVQAAPQPEEPIDEPEQQDVTAEDLVGEMPDEPMTLAASDRVSETLKAPFSFPWNKRRTGGDGAKDDSHLAAE